MLGVFRGNGDAVVERRSKLLYQARQTLLSEHGERCMRCGVIGPVIAIDESCVLKPLSKVSAVNVCALCYAERRLETASDDRFQIIYCPELTQSQINAVAYACSIWCTAKEMSRERAEAEGTIVSLSSRSYDVEMSWGPKACQPSRFSSVLKELPAPEYKQREKAIRDLRLLPSMTMVMVLSSQYKQHRVDSLALMPEFLNA